MRRVCLLVLTLLIGGCASTAPTSGGGDGDIRNVILVVADGAGPAYFTMTRDFERATGGDGVLAFDEHLTGSVRTYSADTKVTDSASSATAYASGIKTNNGYLGEDPDGRPVGTLLEAAEADGRVTGLVTTARITHATPAAFYTHNPDRGEENEIAATLLDSGVDVVFGGGARHFLPADRGGSRVDGRDLLAEAEDAGYAVATDRRGFEGITAAPVVALMAASHLDYEIDRDPNEQVSLNEMTERALELLSGEEEPFFLMIEAGRPDHAGHINDPASLIREMQAFEEAFETIIEFAERDGRTLVVSTSDHETGGLALGPGDTYQYWPERLEPVSKSAERFAAEFQQLAERGASASDLRTWVDRQLALHFATESVDNDRSERMDLLVRAARQRPGNVTARAVADEVMDIISDMAWVGWYSTSHSAVDVPLFAFGPGSDRFRGGLDNTDINHRLAELMDLDMNEVTMRLRRNVQTD